MSEAEFSVPTIDCEGCARSIKAALGRVEGTRAVEVDVAHKRVLVQYDADRLTSGRLRDALETAGFVVE